MAIRVEETFRVDAPWERAWAYIGDPVQVAPCLPGARLTEVVDDRHYNGEVSIKVGPVSAVYRGTVTVEELDAESGRMTMLARATQVGAVGRAEARITCTVRPAGPQASDVAIAAEMTISGRLMQLAGGLVGTVAKRVIGEFGRNVQDRIASADQ